MYHIKRIASAIRTGSDSCAPLYDEIASMTSLTYRDVKEKIKQDHGKFVLPRFMSMQQYMNFLSSAGNLIPCGHSV